MAKKRKDGESTNPGKIQWHPAFCASMELEFMENWKDLRFEAEHLLSRKPLQMDLLIIRNDGKAAIKNPIGHMFRTYNILEYKSPGAAMNIDSFYKTNAYACLYKAEAGRVNGYPAQDITITLLRYEYPAEMIKSLLGEGYGVEAEAPGIFYITGRVMFPTQLIVGKRLRPDEHIWLNSLTTGLTKKRYADFVDVADSVEGKHEKECAEAVLEVVSSANQELIRDWKKEEESMMTATLREIFAPELEEREQRGLQQGMNQGRELKLISLICRKLKKEQKPEEIAEALEEELEVVERICKVAKENAPEYDEEAIYRALHEEE